MLQKIWIYITEFRLKNLVGFEECKLHYRALTHDELMAEAVWLVGEETRALPFQLITQRCGALFDEMAQRAACSKDFSHERRREFILAIIALKEGMLSRTPEETWEQLNRVLDDICKRMRRAGQYKQAADMIIGSLKNYKGPFGPRRVIIHPGSQKKH